MAKEFYASGEILTTINEHEMVNQIHGYDDSNPSNHHHHNHNHHNHHHQIFSMNTTTSLIDFSKRQQHHHHHHHHHHNGFEETNECDDNLLLEDSSPSIRCNNGDFQLTKSSKGLSLSLSSSNPTIVGSSSNQGNFDDNKPHDLQHTQMMMMMNNNNHNHHHHHQQQHHQNQNQVLFLRSSKYLMPTQELLNEFCSLEIKQNDDEIMMMKQKNQKGKQQQQEINDISMMKNVPPLHSIEFMELQKRKAKLLSMLEQIDRRYTHYRDQMRTAAATFEAMAGVGAAETYTALAAKAMSRHFRCLRDAVVGQIQTTKKAMGEREDPVAPGTTRGETPRLRLLDQAFRQQKVYRQMSIVDAHPWRPQRGLPERAVSILRAWLFEHFLHPYPSDIDKHILARQTGLSRSQVSNWFINARVRLWKPMIEEMYSEETRGEQNFDDEINENRNSMLTDPKTEPNPVNRIEPESLSSIVSNPTSNTDPKSHYTFDFPLYGHQVVTYTGDCSNLNGTRDVSLTLGLQRNDGDGGVSLAFSPAAQGGPLYYGRDHMEESQHGSVQYSTSLLDDDQAQNLPYRNLMGAQLLHDIV